MLAHSALAVLAGRSYVGPQSGRVALDVRYDLIARPSEVVIVMPGTHPGDPLDWVRDLRAWPSWLRGVGPAHSGFAKGAEAIWPRLDSYHCALPNGVAVTYTGHSLGGALALVLAAIHARRVARIPFRVVTFGAPRIAFLNPWLGRLARSGFEAIEYQRAGDIVPDVPLRPLYRHPTRPLAIGASCGDFVKNHSIALYAADLAALEEKKS
jgi:pimeloyl-ACP methyl ester carboxylesterase